MKKIIKNLLPFITTVSCFGCIYWFHAIFFNTLKEECLIAAFGASAVLAFSNFGVTSQYAPKNMFLGAMLGASIGVYMNTIHLDRTVAILFAISSCVLLMDLTKLKYPPGGAMALLPIVSNNKEIQDLGYFFILCPVLTGIGIIFFFSKLQKTINNRL